MTCKERLSSTMLATLNSQLLPMAFVTSSPVSNGTATLGCTTCGTGTTHRILVVFYTLTRLDSMAMQPISIGIVGIIRSRAKIQMALPGIAHYGVHLHHYPVFKCALRMAPS